MVSKVLGPKYDHLDNTDKKKDRHLLQDKKRSHDNIFKSVVEHYSIDLPSDKPESTIK